MIISWIFQKWIHNQAGAQINEKKAVKYIDTYRINRKNRTNKFKRSSSQQIEREVPRDLKLTGVEW